MPAIAKKTRQQVRRLVEMFGGGYQIATIAKVEKLDRKTVRRWLEDEGIDVTKAPKTVQQAVDAEKARRGRTSGIVVKALELKPKPGESQSVTVARARLVQISALYNDALKAVAAGELRETAVTKLGELERHQQKHLAELERAEKPPETPKGDPGVDEEILAALDAKEEQLVAREEKNLRCIHCNQHPYR